MPVTTRRRAYAALDITCLELVALVNEASDARFIRHSEKGRNGGAISEKICRMQQRYKIGEIYLPYTTKARLC